jgi:hypothetical protein
MVASSSYGGSTKVRSGKVERGFGNEGSWGGGRERRLERGRVRSRHERVEAKREERLLVLTSAKAVQ